MSFTFPVVRSSGLCARDQLEAEDAESIPEVKDDPSLASSRDAVFVMVNIATGTGMLALPYAFQEGGILFATIGLAAILAWNWVCSILLLDCKSALTEHWRRFGRSPEEEAMSTYAAVGHYAMGAVGEGLVHFSVVVTLLGACAVYLITAGDLLARTPLYIHMGANWRDRDAQPSRAAIVVNTALYACVVFPLTLFKNLAPLQHASVLSLVAFGAAFVVILAEGWSRYGLPSPESIWEDPATWLPDGGEGLSAWFGVAVFAFGVTLLTFNVQESMRRPQEFPRALGVTAAVVWAIYTLLGGATAIVYSPKEEGLGDNIMDDLPVDSTACVILRVCTCVALLLTYPPVLLPVAEMADRRLGRRHWRRRNSRSPGVAYSSIGEGDSGGGGVREPEKDPEPSRWQRFLTRAALVATTAIFAALVPHFGPVVSLLGCCSVSLGCFVAPPLFHVAIFRRTLPLWRLLAEFSFTVLGLFTCIATTIWTAKSLPSA